MKKVNKIYGGIYTKGPNQETDSFLVDKKQLEAEQLLLPFYLWETIAHDFMLAKNNIIPAKSAKKILRLLIRLEKDTAKGKMRVDSNIGDVHENVEYLLTQKIGEDAGWMHAARSRNDQITTDQKLLTKKLCLDLFEALLQLNTVLSQKVHAYKDVPMPGFTHLRVAMPSSVGFWFQSYLEQLLEAQYILQAVFEQIDKSPLGAGASYGVNWPINPEETAQSMGFSKPFSNALAAIDSRGIHELYLVSVMVALLTFLSRMMEDIIIFTMPENGYFSLDESFTTGSSIMPQKMNPDVAEKVRSKVSVVLGLFTTLSTVTKGTASGFSRDSAETKTAIIQAFQESIQCVVITSQMLSQLIPNPKTMETALTPSLATYLADSLSKTYTFPFRTSHHVVGKALLFASKDIQQLKTSHIEKAMTEITGKNIFLPKDFLQVIFDQKKILSNYSYKGSPNPKFVAEVQRELEKDHKKFAMWIDKEISAFFQIKETLFKKVEEFIKEE